MCSIDCVRLVVVVVGLTLVAKLPQCLIFIKVFGVNGLRYKVFVLECLIRVNKTNSEQIWFQSMCTNWNGLNGRFLLLFIDVRNQAALGFRIYQNIII